MRSQKILWLARAFASIGILHYQLGSKWALKYYRLAEVSPMSIEVQQTEKKKQAALLELRAGRFVDSFVATRLFSREPQSVHNDEGSSFAELVSQFEELNAEIPQLYIYEDMLLRCAERLGSL
ncbi:hypothetical protein PAPYR_2146 [Paratrimastix pyriformis]|uniref:Uncharacterized protein n=1 Tax=Paratrimastix pyriformis TaxID=342808 RepID=A0ABQ8UT93_9EUKA|nr:hypothetical protein PAPYR_2146 [Paratrimastix pyriformis]